MTLKQRIALAVTALALTAVVVFLIWFLRKPEESPKGVLVYREAYMHVAEQPWQGGRLCRNR
ncbi:MAG: hypothetical protein IJD26_04710 [Lachnospiraceae bacterium]|nr:hypothetical protein [Lachnospiraceae bacterium]